MTDVSAPQKRKRGRPSKGESDRKNTYLGFRVRDGMREKLTAAAEAGSRSPSEEIERRLIKSFEDEQHIADLEDQIGTMKRIQSIFWPDAAAKELGEAFALTLIAVQHATGQHWRESSMAAPIIAGVVRRMIDACSRGGSLASDLFDRDRITAATNAIAQTMLGNLDKDMPPLPPLPFQDDPANWTNRAYSAMTFREKATGKILQVVRGPEFVLGDREAERGLGPDFHAAIERFRPIRDTVDAEDFFVHVLKDGSTSWERLSGTGGKIHVPAGQDAPPAIPAEPQPTPPIGRRVGPEEAARDFVSVDDPKRPAAIFDGSDFANLGMEQVGDDPDDTQGVPPTPAPTKPRGRKAKASA